MKNLLNMATRLINKVNVVIATTEEAKARAVALSAVTLEYDAHVANNTYTKTVEVDLLNRVSMISEGKPAEVSVEDALSAAFEDAVVAMQGEEVVDTDVIILGYTPAEAVVEESKEEVSTKEDELLAVISKNMLIFNTKHVKQVAKKARGLTKQDLKVLSMDVRKAMSSLVSLNTQESEAINAFLVKHEKKTGVEFLATLQASTILFSASQA